MGKPMNITRASIENKQEVLALSAEMLAFHISLDSYYGIYSAYEDHEQFYTDQLKKPNVAFFLAQEAGQPVGIISGSVTEMEESDAPKIGRVISLFVVAEARGKGVGAALYEALLLWLKEKGVKHIEASVDHQNDQALEFWRHRGFGDYQIELRLDL